MHKGRIYVTLLTGFLLGIFLLLPVHAEANEERPTSDAAADQARFSAVPNQTHRQFLPIIAYIPPLTLISGELRLDTKTEGHRAQGLTIFILPPGGDESQFLDAKDLLFNYSPVRVKVCQDINFNCGAERASDLSVPFPRIDNLNIGLNQVIVEFRHDVVSAGPSPITTTLTLLQPFTFFYIPNGDFQDGVLEPDWLLHAMWTAPPPSGTTLPSLQDPRTGDDKLLLDPIAGRRCTAAYRSSASASLPIQIPPHSDYKLYIEGTVYTQDLNPSNTATYDSFEVAINNQLIQRYSNQQPPISCSNPLFRQIPVELQVPLSSYAGQIVLSLENHLRYDHYFYTYTEIDTVWIDK